MAVHTATKPLLTHEGENGNQRYLGHMQGSELQARCKAHGATTAELAAMTATSAALAAERERLVADLAAKRTALATADELAANIRAELEKHCREAADHKEAAQKVPSHTVIMGIIQMPHT